MKSLEYNIVKILTSEKKSLQEIEPVLFEMKDSFRIADNRFYNILIAVTEALNNAIIHGNRLAPDKEIIFSVDADDHEVIITVEDQGEGFDPDTIADPREPQNLLKESGRGIFLIRSLSDHVDYDVTLKGTRIIMRFVID